MRAVVAVLVLAACGGAPKPAPQPPPAPAAPTIESRLLGHWRTEDGKTDYYFRLGTLTMIDQGEPQEQTWKIVGSNTEARTLDIAIIRIDTGKGHDKHIVFTPDFHDLDESITMSGFTVSTKWHYVDATQSALKP